MWIRGRRFRVALRDELEFHRAQLQRALEYEGMRPVDAARESRRRMGNMILATEDACDVWIWRWLDSLVQDVRYALGGMRAMRQGSTRSRC